MHSRLFIPLIPLLLSGCSLIPDYQRPGAPVADRWPNGGGGSSKDGIDSRGFFGDPRLRRIIALSLENNRDVRIAALNVEQIRAQYRISRSELFPTVGVGGEAASGRSAGTTTHLYGATVGVTSYELDLFGRVRSLNKSALENYLASDEARRGVQLALASEVAVQYLTERALLEQIALSERTLGAVSKTYDLINQRFTAGDASDLDVQSVNTQVQTAKVNLATYRQQLAQTQNALMLLSGNSIPSNLPGGRGLDSGIVHDLSPGLPSSLVTRRPDIREAEHNLIGANADIGAARAAFFPSVTLTANGGTASSSFSRLFKSGSGTWLFSPQINLPIFTGGRNQANLDAAVVRKNIQVATYEKTIQTAFREVADGLAARSGLANRISATEALVAAQEKRFSLADARYQRGVDSYFEVLSAQQDLYAAQQSLIQLRLSREANLVSLYKALGGGW
ncbi:efflux transporter outer membrane subunit [Luteolibacter ambystomatis]|uniref:Efflux transporter outer membrane subunit n=1 Tax=Luteolibacter ambystomatis TaxID=2824561 RepID=A0A975J269_9BACT|nr:efflux transporter outer membrane subunit [Luteolibacter ambystomatis]QUE52670.1 efflux transporter outer membrane subunit [Luteolibacter ambystomatis]